MNLNAPEIDNVLREIYRLPIPERKYHMKRLREALTGKKEPSEYLFEDLLCPN